VRLRCRSIASPSRACLDHYAGQCVDKYGTNVLTKGLQQTIVSHGYITTRLLLPEQDLASGTLRLTLVPGVIRNVRFAEPIAWGTWKDAFPTRPGDVLDLYDLEQGVEQMKRAASQDGDMKIEPTEQPGERDIVLSVKQSKPRSVVASVDNSGSRATGKLQGNLSIGLDNLLGLNDVRALRANQDLELGDSLVFGPVGLLDSDAFRQYEHVLSTDRRCEYDLRFERQFADGGRPARCRRSVSIAARTL
jgi:hemolysin activation/secretion protein